MTVSFTDNLIVNGAGIDFTIFGINNPSEFKVTLNGATLTRSTVLAQYLANQSVATRYFGCL